MANKKFLTGIEVDGTIIKKDGTSTQFLKADGSVEELPVATEEDAILGESNTTIITPLLLKEIIELITVPYYGAQQDLDLGEHNITVNNATFNSITVASGVIHSSTVNETPGGMINGVNTIFTLAKPFVVNSTKVFLNTVRQILGLHYTEFAQSIVFQFGYVPETLDTIRVDYDNL